MVHLRSRIKYKKIKESSGDISAVKESKTLKEEKYR